METSICGAIIAAAARGSVEASSCTEQVKDAIYQRVEGRELHDRQRMGSLCALGLALAAGCASVVRMSGVAEANEFARSES